MLPAAVVNEGPSPLSPLQMIRAKESPGPIHRAGIAGKHRPGRLEGGFTGLHFRLFPLADCYETPAFLRV
ncbi:unnamed protein product [Arctogadus glacialis]